MGPQQAPRRIQDLVRRWYLEAPVARLRELPDPEDLPPVPDGLAATITGYQPFRNIVEADARLWCAFPRPVGPGMEIELLSSIDIAAFEFWNESFSPVTFECSWYDSMDDLGIGRHHTKVTWQRVALEAGQWKVVQLWDEKERQEIRSQYEQMYRHFRSSLDPFARDGSGRTALFKAATVGDLDRVREIIFSLPGTGVLPQRLALLEVEDGDGQTAADVAAEAGHDEVARLLRGELLRMRYSE